MAEKRRGGAGSAAAVTGGTVTAGAGLAASGMPGARANADKLDSWKATGDYEGTSRTRKKAAAARAKAPAARAMPGGVFGYRVDAHERFLNREEAKETANAKKTPLSAIKRSDAFHRGVAMGKFPSERKVIGHLKTGRKVGAAMLVGGTGTAYAGARRSQGKKVFGKSQRHTEQYSGALAGGGLTAAGLSHGGAKLTGSQERKWKGRAVEARGEAQKIIPNVKNLSPKPAAEQALKGKSKAQAFQAGQHLGDEGQAKYFAHVYGKHAKMFRKVTKPAAAVGALGAGGLVASRMKDEKVRKSMSVSAFGVDHGAEFGKKYSFDPEDPNTKKKASGGRRALAYVGGPIHGGVAGKKGKKLRSAGNEYGGAMLGTVAGSAVGGRYGGLAGGVTGSQLGLNRNQRKGYLKPES